MEDQLFWQPGERGEQPMRSTARSQRDEDVSSPGARSAQSWVLASSPAAGWRAACAAVRLLPPGANPPLVSMARLQGFTLGRMLIGEATIAVTG